MSEFFEDFRNKFGIKRTNSSSEPEIDVEPKNEVNEHINSGINMLKEKRYAEVIEHFCNKENAKKIGILVSQESQAIGIDVEKVAKLSEDDIDRISDEIAVRSKYNTQTEEIKLARVFVYDMNNLKQDIPLGILPERMLQEIALVTAEEWLHIKQGRTGTLTGIVDVEKDVAKYFSEQGVEMTKKFLGRYGRDQVLRQDGAN